MHGAAVLFEVRLDARLGGVLRQSPNLHGVVVDGDGVHVHLVVDARLVVEVVHRQRAQHEHLRGVERDNRQRRVAVRVSHFPGFGLVGAPEQRRAVRRAREAAQAVPPGAVLVVRHVREVEQTAGEHGEQQERDEVVAQHDEPKDDAVAEALHHVVQGDARGKTLRTTPVLAYLILALQVVRLLAAHAFERELQVWRLVHRGSDVALPRRRQLGSLLLLAERARAPLLVGLARGPEHAAVRAADGGVVGVDGDAHGGRPQVHARGDRGETRVIFDRGETRVIVFGEGR